MMLRTVRLSLLAATVAGTAVVSTPSFAEVSATAGVANLYLWRGQNLGGGSPVVMGSLDYTHETGLFAGAWGSSAGPDSEVDLYAGYEYEGEDFGFTAAFYDYSYPRSATTGDLQEAYVSLGAAGFKAEAYVGMGDWEDDNYFAVGYTHGKFGAKVGMTALDAADSDYSHLDLSYAWNDNLSFTVSGVLDADDASMVTDVEDPLFVVSYSLPLDLKQ